MTLGEFDDVVARLEDAPRPFDDLLAGHGERHALRRALDELHAEVFLELLELRRQRRLAHEAAFSRAPEVAGVRHGDEISQILELEVCHRCSLSSLYNQLIG